jgi:alanine racemase
VWEGGQLQRLRAAARRSPKDAPVSIHLKVDTGMGRLGCLPEELPAVIEAWRACSTELVVEGLMTHLACADEDDDPASDGQLQRFEAARGSLAAAGIIPRWIHAANSAATLRYRAAHYDLVRPGLAMYGVRPGGVREAFDGVGVLSLTSRVSALRELPAGHGVSYGHDTTLARATRAAIVPVGYEDGYPRRASGQAVVLVRGQRCAVLGRVTMDTLVVDVTAIPEVAVGDVVTLIGADEAARVEVADLARWAGLSTYEVLCGVSARVPRV